MTEQPRPGDQPLPDEAATQNTCVQDAMRDHWGEATGTGPQWDDLIGYLERRKKLGIARYGQALHIDNGRDAGVDAFEEAFDLVMYVAQMILERDGELPPLGEYYPEHGEPDCLFTLFDMAQECLASLAWLVRDIKGQLPEVVIPGE